MKLDRDGSGSIDKDEFLQIPAIANNPLASRLIAIFDEESVLSLRHAVKVSVAHALFWLAVEVELSTFRNSYRA